MRCLLIGNYGVSNLGDEALKDYFQSRFTEVEWTVLSADPKVPNEVPRLPFGLFSLFTPWWRTIRAYMRCDLVVFGGGSLFTDVESVQACFLWWWHAFVADIFRKPVALAFQGIGPFHTRIGKWCAMDVARHLEFVSVRDDESQQRIWTTAAAHVVLTFDPVLSLFAPNSGVERKKTLVIIPRANSGKEMQTLALEAIAREKPDAVHILSMEPDTKAEHLACLALRNVIGEYAVITEIYALADLARELSECSFAITARYHGAIAALATRTPVQIVPQREGDKLDALRKITGEDLVQLHRRVAQGQEEFRKFLQVVTQ